MNDLRWKTFRSRSFLTKSFLASIIFITIYQLGEAHSFLVDPSPDWKVRGRAHCRRGGPLKTNHDNCAGPCISRTSVFFDKSANVTTWRRGEIRKARWTRNNHRRGFVRLSLVRSSERMSDNAHALGAFHYSCFESRPIPCDHEKVFCGTDVILHETSFTVPCVPDGEYVLGWSWYGAYAKGRGQSSLYNFGDYWSCSFIRIEGGSPVRPLCRFPVPKFVSGTDQSQCEALSNRVGMCNIEPCPYLKQIQGSALLCPDPMVKIGTECIPYFPRKTLVHVPGPQLQISEYRYCSTFRSHGATASNRLEFLAGFLDKKGHLVSVQRVCDKSVVPDLQLHYGMTILALVTGAHKALIFRVDGTSVNYEHIQPYSIAGNMGNIFNSFIPPRYNSLVNITAIIQDENGKYSRPHHFQVKFETVSNNTH